MPEASSMASGLTWIYATPLSIIMAWISNSIYGYMWDVVIRPCHNFRVGLTNRHYNKDMDK